MASDQQTSAETEKKTLKKLNWYIFYGIEIFSEKIKVKFCISMVNSLIINNGTFINYSSNAYQKI